jgi:hypothetical protein
MILPPLNLSPTPTKRRVLVTMQPTAVWIIYTLMFGYPMPTRETPQFNNEASCQVYLGTLDQQVVKAFQLVCSRDHV